MFEFNFKNFNPRNLVADRNFKVPKLSGEFFSENSSLLWEIFFLIIILLGVLNFVFASAPKHFPVGAIVSVEEGDTLSTISEDLKSKGVIKSKIAFEIITRLIATDKSIMSGDYFFEESKNTFFVARRMVKGIYGLTPIRITLQEGLTVNQMSEVLAKKFSEFDSEEFIQIAEEEKKEGYLFPDTYLFLPNIKATDVIRAMESNFYVKINDIQEQISTSEYTLHQIITMASILEEEGITFQDRKMMSGVLWNRIEIDMPLQVDAVFPYIIGKNTYEVNLEDLKNESPYNTYVHKGLPPGPITNPGLNSIVATLEPVEHDYYYYLSDRQNKTYYAETFEQHKVNRVLYLDK